MDNTEHKVKLPNQKANMISRQCLTDRHTVFTSRVIFDYMFNCRFAFLNIVKVVAKKKKIEYPFIVKCRLFGCIDYLFTR